MHLTNFHFFIVYLRGLNFRNIRAATKTKYTEVHYRRIFMKYKLIFLDLDGTLTNGKKEITPHTLDTLLKAQEKGIKVVLASGRPTYGIAPIARKLKLDQYGGYILSYNGGEIINWQTGELLYKNLLEPEVIPYLYQCAKDNDFTIMTYDGEYVVTENPNDIYVKKAALVNVMSIKEVENFLEAITERPIVKCLIMGNAEKLAVLEKEMHDALKDKMGVFRSEPYFLELVPHGIDKAHSSAFLLKSLGIDKDEIIAIGDGFNDVSMIKYAGLGVAMANAQKVVRENANYITLSNEEDGVAHVIEKFVLTE